VKVRVAEENVDAEKFIPPAQPDGSRIGVNYVDAYIEVLNAALDDGRKVSCEREGLKILLQIGDSKGAAILRRIDHGPDVRTILRKALEAAAEDADSRLSVEDGVIYLEV
jgi:hypothetical protein